jgi:hypothetical protein
MKLKDSLPRLEKDRYYILSRASSIHAPIAYFFMIYFNFIVPSTQPMNTLCGRGPELLNLKVSE